jgi:thiamine transport system substrate-binding protein
MTAWQIPSSTVRAAVVLTVLLAGSGAVPVAAGERVVRLLTHASFYLPPEVLAAFEDEHGVRVEVVFAGDAGAMVNDAVLVRLAGDEPVADVLYGVDNTFLSRALEAGIFEPYRSARTDAVAPAFLLPQEDRVTPVDHADVCLNIDVQAFEERGLPVPERLDDLLDPALRDALVVEDPAVSSPGLAFLLATIVTYGEDPDDGWHGFWRGLRENGVEVASDWGEAYYERFSGGTGEGDRPIVVSYATSPVAEVLAGPDPAADIGPTRAIEAGCFRQIEYAAVLAGAREAGLAGAFIDHLVAPDTQAALPLAMYVLPVRDDVPLPAAFERHALRPAAPLTMDPEAIDDGRGRWIDEWTAVVLR